MRRRDFIKSIVGAATTWPLAARAEQGERMRRIGVLSSGGAVDDSDVKAFWAAFRQGLEQLGWTEGRNVQIDARLGQGDADLARKYAAELVALTPDVILTSGSGATEQLIKTTRTVPIVFVAVPDPVGSGFVDSLSQPGGNATGFLQFEYSLSGKWLELLKQIAPSVTRAAVLWDPSIIAGIGQFAVIQSVAPSLGVDVRPVNLKVPSEVERTISAFARPPNGGLLVTAGGITFRERDFIAALAARQRLPAVAPWRFFVRDGGLMSYGPDFADQFRRAAGYVDRILKGEKPGDLPVQAPTKYELVINLKTAKSLGITGPQSLLASADEVIE
jgi:putative tryptophan/tyrosine transport system substrate-binding protein